MMLADSATLADMTTGERDPLHNDSSRNVTACSEAGLLRGL